VRTGASPGGLLEQERAMLERIISRGAGGVERAALEAASVAGLLTGGQSRPGVAPPAVARRLGLAVDPCSRRQALLANVRRAQGTLVVGPASRRLLGLLGPRVFHVEATLVKSAQWLADWVRWYGVRTLNVVGGSGHDCAEAAGRLVLDAAALLGRRPALPMERGCAAIAVNDRLCAVRLWPTPRAWVWRQRAWVPFRRWDQLVEFAQRRCGSCGTVDRSPADVLVGLLPSAVRDAVSWTGTVDVSRLAAMCRMRGPAVDLARAKRWGVLGLLTGPATPSGHRIGRRALRRLSRQRQRDVLGAFGFPPTEAAVRAMAKVTRPVADVRVDQLRQLLHDPAAAAALRHLTRINRPVLELVADPTTRRACAPSLLAAVAGHFDEEYGIDLLCNEYADLARRLRNRPVPDGSLRTFEQISAITAGPAVDPPPPPPGLAGRIDRLSNAAALRAEGEAMQHCVAIYRGKARAGGCAIYRVTADATHGVDRATLMLRPAADGSRWELTQLSGQANRSVSDGTTALVAAWMCGAATEPKVTAGSGPVALIG
jgi:hypothetical protein